jgi:hypothetical protein
VRIDFSPLLSGIVDFVLLHLTPMASSFSSQIPVIIWMLQSLRPRTILDVGKGLGKYGFLAHEYLGLDERRRPDPRRTIAEQSRVILDAVECNPDFMWPHIAQIYTNVFSGRIEELYPELPAYELVLMCDVIEHLKKEDGHRVLRYFLSQNSTIIVSTPRRFFQQELYESADEHHLSFWGPADFRMTGAAMDWQTVDAGRVFLLSTRPLNLRGFGNSVIKRIRRISRALANEMRG